MRGAEFTIGHLSRETGCKVPTIRYYEKIGLLPEPARTAGNTRIYGRDHLDRLGFIRHCRELGFAQKDVRQLLDLADQPDQSCVAVTEIASEHLKMVDQRIAKLMALKVELEHMIIACQGGRIAQCRIVETLADRSREERPAEDHSPGRSH